MLRFELATRTLQLARALCFALGCLALAERLARFQEGELQLGQLIWMTGGPLLRLGETRTPVQAIFVSPEPLPFECALGQVAVEAESLTVLVEPGAQRRPLSASCATSA